jgi:hypothetical protein
MPEARERLESSSIRAVSQVVDQRPNRARYSIRSVLFLSVVVFWTIYTRADGPRSVVVSGYDIGEQALPLPWLQNRSLNLSDYSTLKLWFSLLKLDGDVRRIPFHWNLPVS